MVCHKCYICCQEEDRPAISHHLDLVEQLRPEKGVRTVEVQWATGACSASFLCSSWASVYALHVSLLLLSIISNAAQMTIQLDDVTPFNGVPIINPITPSTEIINPISSTPFPPMTPVTNPNTNLPPMIGNSGTPTTSSGQSWCIASQSANEMALQVALDYACGYGGADCSAIQQGGSCFNPNTVRDHASYAFNSYYQKNPVPTSCDFGGTAMVTNTDPSIQNCQYPASSTSPAVPNVNSPYGLSPVNGQPVYGSVPNTTPYSSFGATTSVDVTQSVFARLLLIVLIINHL